MLCDKLSSHFPLCVAQQFIALETLSSQVAQGRNQFACNKLLSYERGGLPGSFVKNHHRLRPTRSYTGRGQAVASYLVEVNETLVIFEHRRGVH